MKKVLVIIFLISSLSVIKAQSNLTVLADKFCNSIKNNHIKDTKNLTIYFDYIMDSVCSANKKRYKKLKLYYKKRNSKLEPYAIHNLAQKNIFTKASKKCKTLQAVSKEKSLKMQSVMSVSEELCQLLNNSDKKHLTVDHIINSKTNELISKHKKIIIAEYGDINSIRFRNDLNESLFNNCDIYYNWFLGR